MDESIEAFVRLETAKIFCRKALNVIHVERCKKLEIRGNIQYVFAIYGTFLIGHSQNQHVCKEICCTT